MKRIGLLVGREWSWPPRFLDEVNGRDAGVEAEFVKLGGTRMDEPAYYDVLIDRISHEVPYYRSYLKKAVLDGVTVVNNPFMWTADDKFFGATLCAKLGLAHPKTVVLPNQDYVPGIVKAESLRNLIYPLDWRAILDHIGLPCILKDAHGGGWRSVYVCHHEHDLIRYYDTSGLLTMVVQEFVHWDRYFRVMCLGRERVLIMPYDPHQKQYMPDAEWLDDALRERITRDSLLLVQALGYDMNTIEWAVRDGVPYAIDFMNPAPDMDINSLTPGYFEWCVKAMADLAIDMALRPRPQLAECRWGGYF